MMRTTRLRLLGGCRSRDDLLEIPVSASFNKMAASQQQEKSRKTICRWLFFMGLASVPRFEFWSPTAMVGRRKQRTACNALFYRPTISQCIRAEIVCLLDPPYKFVVGWVKFAWVKS